MMSAPALTLLHWIAQTADNEGQPFAIIDKRRARLWLFDQQGHRQGDSPVLLGLARGDASVPGIGERPLKDVRPFERTTPAGRFIVHQGRNLQQEDIFWVDYEAAVSLHRVRATNKAERRLERLATPSPADNRISYGCINVPPAFYDGRIRPLFLPAQAVVYLLPETLPLRALFRPVPQHSAAPAALAAHRA